MPEVKDALQVVPQLIPAGLELTVPLLEVVIERVLRTGEPTPVPGNEASMLLAISFTFA